MSALFTHEQFLAFSHCLGTIYNEPSGENSVDSIIDAVERLLRIDSIAVDETKADGPHIRRHQRVTHRRPELMEAAPDLIPQIAHDHPLIQQILQNRKTTCLKISDFLTHRQLRNISLYSFNNPKHEWRDQAMVFCPVSGGTLSLTLNRDRVFTHEEFLMLQHIQPHVRRVLSRCAWFVLLPGNEQLTPREREVLYWITQGKRDDEIASIVACAERTVRQHTRAVLRKLGVENRTTAVSEVLSGRATA